jgi:hypothetical protein
MDMKTPFRLRAVARPGSLILAAALATVPNTAKSVVPDRCHARLLLTLAPDVPNPRDPSFLSALSANPLYAITWVEGNGSTAVVDLTGPATDFHCDDEIRRLSRDAHILTLKVLPPDKRDEQPSGPT